MKNLFKHLKTVHTHRKYVRKACWKMGLFWQGLLHDLSKYSITELKICKYYTGTKSPHQACREMIGYSPICESEWPVYDEAKTVENTKEIAVQVNGKVRATIEINIEDDEQSIKEKAMDAENVIKHIEGKEIVKVIVIKGKIVNIVVK